MPRQGQGKLQKARAKAAADAAAKAEAAAGNNILKRLRSSANLGEDQK